MLPSRRNIFLVASICCALHFVHCQCDDEQNPNTNWVPTIVLPSNNSEIWVPKHKKNLEHTAKISPRAILDDRFESEENALDFNIERNQLKAVPFYRPTQVAPATTNNQPVRLQIRPATATNQAAPTLISNSDQYYSSQFSPPHQTLQAPSVSSEYAQGQGYHYPAPELIHQYRPPPPTPGPQYLPPSLSNQYLPASHQPALNIEIFESFSNHTSSLETNTNNVLYLQPGKCSNSIEVGRIRDVEVKTTSYKNGMEVEKGICVLMLYAKNEMNKLAVSLRAAPSSTDLIPIGSWLETNVKIHALQAGDIQPVITNSNFGLGSPALILTKSSIVVLSIVIDRAVDFFVDISTYQSQYC